MYNIGEVSSMFNLPVPTLRYYDKEGLLVDLERDHSGIRKFNDKTLDALRVIECLKKSGMQIKEIKEFMDWCSLGDNTIETRRNMFLKQKENIEAEIEELEKALSMIKYKCWYYTEALNDNSESRVRQLTTADMPDDIRDHYEKAHE